MRLNSCESCRMFVSLWLGAQAPEHQRLLKKKYLRKKLQPIWKNVFLITLYKTKYLLPSMCYYWKFSSEIIMWEKAYKESNLVDHWRNGSPLIMTRQIWRNSCSNATNMALVLLWRHKRGATVILTSQIWRYSYGGSVILTLKVCITSMSVLFITAS